MDARPSRTHIMLQHALLAAQRGTCSRALVGVVITVEGRIVVTGYNGAPRKMQHCIHPEGEITSGSSTEAQGCTTAVHAEANAIAYAARFGTRLDGGEMYCTHAPCLACAQLIVNAGISFLTYIKPYRDPSGLRLLHDARVSYQSWLM